MRVDPDLRPTLASLGAVLAGGESRRFGSPKAVAPVGGVALLRRVQLAMESVVQQVVVVSGNAEVLALARLPARPDLRPGNGPLGGVETALHWAREIGVSGALCVACDLPFLPAELLRSIVERGLGGDSAVVLPEGAGPAGVEPLCAWYSVRALPQVRAALDRGRRSMTDLVALLPAERIPIEEVRRFGDPAEIFINVNTRAGQRDADRLAQRERARGDQ